MKDLPRLAVDDGNDLIKVVLGYGRKIHTLGNIPPDHLVCVLNPSFLPRRVWIAEEGRDTEFDVIPILNPVVLRDTQGFFVMEHIL